MSMPNIPNITPEINLCKEDVKNVLLAATALQEISLSHILNAQGEKIQQVIKNNEDNFCISDFLEINTSVEKLLHKIYKVEELLIEKLRLFNDL